MNTQNKTPNKKSPSYIEVLLPVAFFMVMLTMLGVAAWVLPGTVFAGSSNGKGQQTSTSSSSSSSSSTSGGSSNGNASSSSGSTSSSSSSSSSSSGSTSSGSTSSSSSSTSGAVQSTQTAFGSTNTVNVDFDGNPSQISGNDHDLNGNTIADQTNSKPAIGVTNMNGDWVDGNGNQQMTGVTVSGTHNDSQVEGGVTNNLNKDRWTNLETFIQNAKNSADITLDTSTNVNITSKINNDQWSVVYARSSDPTKEGALHFAGSGGGRGVLIVEVNDPTKGQLLMNANAEWVGLVIVVVNYRDTANNNNGNGTPIDLRGSGNNGGGHIIGGGIVYERNQKPGSGQTGTIYLENLANTSGGGSLIYSTEALTNATVKVLSSMQVVSWRKLPVP